jgi:hypothetical protein
MRTTVKRLTLIAGLSLLSLAGCRSNGSKDSGPVGLFGGGSETEATAVSRNNDPLFGDRIPKQNLPTRSSDAIGAKTRDPLFGVPPSGDKTPTERAAKPENKGSASLNGKYPEPYRPSRETTNAALAAAIAPDDSTLSIGPRRTPGATTSGRTLMSYEQMVNELRRLGARIGEPTREKGNYVVRAEVPIDVDIPGPARWYEGVGSTPAVALKQILDQVRTDKSR